MTRTNIIAGMGTGRICTSSYSSPYSIKKSGILHTHTHTRDFFLKTVTDSNNIYETSFLVISIRDSI